MTKKALMWLILISVSLPLAAIIIILFIFLVAYFGVVYGYVFQPNSLMNDYQGYLYYGGMRSIYQTKNDCVQYDENLLYKPKIGRCEFRNTEFDNELNFDKYGRYRPPETTKTTHSAVAVIGDSHAMGWGVNDNETFSYTLASSKNIPVYNLAVASYGTYRELLRLEASGLLNKIDTIVIQYCENDISENTHLLNKKTKFKVVEFNDMLNVTQQNWIIEKWIRVAFKLAIQRVTERLDQDSELNFTKHFEEFSKVINMFEWIKEKEIIVFYSNAHGKKFKNFENFQIQNYPNIKFIEMNLSRNDYYILDDHLNADGHNVISKKLSDMIDL